jgi:hypothetical protein
MLVPATATSTITKGGWVAVGLAGGGLFDPHSSRVPQCIERYPDLRPPRPPRHPDQIEPGDLDRIRHQTERFFECIKRFFGGAGHLGSSFVVSLQRGNELRACNLLTRDERGRLGGDACPKSLAGLDHRLREERKPQIYVSSFSSTPLRGELDLTMVRPFEKVGMRFGEEGGFFRISNVRDLLRQQPPSG